MNIRRVVTLSMALVVFASATSTLLAQRGGRGGAPNVAAQREEQQRNKNQQADVVAINQMLAAATTAQPVSPTSTAADEQQGAVKVTWEMNHFIKGQGGLAYVPFTIVVDRAALTSEKVVVTLRAVNKNAPAAPAAAAPPADNRNNRNQPAAAPAPMYAWNDFDFLSLKDDGKVSRAMMLPAGDYDLFVVVKDQSNGDNKQMPKSGMLRRKLSVPDFSKTELMTSSVLLGGIDELPSALPANQQRENPYTFGPMKVTPTVNGKFAKTSELALIFWIYGAGTDAISRRPNLTVDYSFYQKNADGTEKYFNKTAPQELNSMTLPPEMDGSTGLPGVMSVPMMVFPAADYRLEIKVSDKASGKTVTQNLNFTVNPS
ncbi:MAG: hypothetical protein ABL986_01125 [Vicinamibacterales bacterium]